MCLMCLIGPVGFFRHIVLGLDDKTIWIWDAEMGKPVGETLQGHTNLIMSVAFSPDGRCIVLCLHNEKIQIWGAETEASGRAITRTHKCHYVCCILAWWQAHTLRLEWQDNSDLGCRDGEASGRAIMRAHRLGHVCCILTWFQVCTLRLEQWENLDLRCRDREASGRHW